MAYSNRAYIADQVLPRVPVAGETFEYLKHNLEDRFTIPDTTIGRKGRANQVEFGSTLVPGSTKDYGLEDVIPVADIDAAKAMPNYDPKGNAVEGLQELIALDRERRVANLVFNLNTYPAANRATLSGTSQWSDYTNSDPIDDLRDALATPIMRPNKIVFGWATWNVLAANPKVATAIYGANSTGKIITREELARVLEVQEILVGQSLANTAKPGQTVSLANLWGKHCALLYSVRPAGTQNGLTFGFTAQYGSRVAFDKFDSDIGLRGAHAVKTGESVGEIISASDVGYFIQNAVA